MTKIQKVREIVSYMMNSDKYDASHDMKHVERVVKLSLYLANFENIKDPETLEVIELSALLHDMNDHKYNNQSMNIEQLLIDIGYSKSIADRVIHVITNTSYSTELEIIQIDKNISSLYDIDDSHKDENPCGLSYNFDTFGVPHFVRKDPMIHTIELCIVQDSLGYTGIARCIYFSGTKKNPLFEESCYDSKGTYIKGSKSKSSISHFYDKLFKLQYLMKTNEGRKLGIERTKIMKQFVSQFEQEWQ